MKTGGPAFLVPVAGDTGGFVDGQEYGAPTGLTIRDFFAAKAMQGILVNTGRNEFSFGKVDEIASKAYEISDAMIEAREGE